MDKKLVGLDWYAAPSSPHQLHYFQDVEEQGHVQEGKRPMYQQSVTLTARMAYHKQQDGWGSFAHAAPHWMHSYLPLLVGILCACAVLTLALSVLVLWRCCLLPRRKLPTHRNTVLSEAPSKASKRTRDGIGGGTCVYAMRNGPWGYHSRVLSSSSQSLSLYPLPSSNSTRRCEVHGGGGDGQHVTKQLTMMMPAWSDSLSYSRSPSHSRSSTYVREASPSSSLHALHLISSDTTTQHHPKSVSTSSLNDPTLYAQVNLRNKRKNRMGKEDAAVIALSKSTQLMNASANPDNDNDQPHVVYNQRTAV